MSVLLAVALGAVVLAAIIAGRRSRRWWLTAGCLIYLVTLVVAALRGELRAWPTGLVVATWLAGTVLMSLVAPLALASDPLSSRPLLIVGVLIGGLGGGVLGFVSIFATSCFFSDSEPGTTVILSTGIMLGQTPAVFAPAAGLPQNASRFQVRLALPPSYELIPSSGVGGRRSASLCSYPNATCHFVGSDGRPVDIEVAALTVDGRRFTTGPAYTGHTGFRFDLHPPLWPPAVVRSVQVKADRPIPILRLTWWNGERRGCTM